MSETVTVTVRVHSVEKEKTYTADIDGFKSTAYAYDDGDLTIEVRDVTLGGHSVTVRDNTWAGQGHAHIDVTAAYSAFDVYMT